jgi:hypothetical protein
MESASAFEAVVEDEATGDWQCAPSGERDPGARHGSVHGGLLATLPASWPPLEGSLLLPPERTDSCGGRSRLPRIAAVQP